MSEKKVACIECGADILPQTAAKTGGQCMPCATGTREQIEEGKRWNAEQRRLRGLNEAAFERMRQKEGATFSDFLGEEDPIGVLWLFLVRSVFHGEPPTEDVATLSAEGRILYFVQILDGEVFNGGFHQYFSNSSGDYAHETRDALQKVGACREAQLLARACEVFPGAIVPKNRKERNERLDSTDAAILDGLDTEYYAIADHGESGVDLGELILAFMRRHATSRVSAA